MSMKPISDRLWAKTDKSGPDDCWEWRGWRHPSGYGQIGRGRRSDGLAYTHVVAWEITNGPIPVGLCVCHKCDNPPCVNPAHLFLGSKADNTHDMVKKRRHRYGELHATKLTDDDISEIRKLMIQGLTQKEIALRFSVSRSLVGMIGRFTRWKLSGDDAELEAALLGRPTTKERTICGNGHIYSDVGFYIGRKGERVCKECHRERVRKYLHNGGRERSRAKNVVLTREPPT